jgi:hypothetical protein
MKWIRHVLGTKENSAAVDAAFFLVRAELN